MDKQKINEEVMDLVNHWKDKEGNLIMILHEIQNHHGYVPRELSLELSRLLNVPLARIYEVITFYNFFKLTPPGKNRIAVFDTSMGWEAYSRLRIRTQLESAIENGELRVLFQPIISLDSREIVGVEALVRWEHPEHGLLQPMEFIPLAEPTGLMGPLTRYVLDLAIAQARAWRDRKLDITVTDKPVVLFAQTPADAVIA